MTGVRFPSPAQELKNQFIEDWVQYHIIPKKITEKSNYYFNILDDYLIEVYIDEKIAK